MEEPPKSKVCWFPFKETYERRRIGPGKAYKAPPEVYYIKKKKLGAKPDVVSVFEYGEKSNPTHVGETELVLKGHPMPLSLPTRYDETEEDDGILDEDAIIPFENSSRLAAINANCMSSEFWDDEVVESGWNCAGTMVEPRRQITPGTSVDTGNSRSNRSDFLETPPDSPIPMSDTGAPFARNNLSRQTSGDGCQTFPDLSSVGSKMLGKARDTRRNRQQYQPRDNQQRGMVQEEKKDDDISSLYSLEESTAKRVTNNSSISAKQLGGSLGFVTCGPTRESLPNCVDMSDLEVKRGALTNSTVSPVVPEPHFYVEVEATRQQLNDVPDFDDVRSTLSNKHQPQSQRQKRKTPRPAKPKPPPRTVQQQRVPNVALFPELARTASLVDEDSAFMQPSTGRGEAESQIICADDSLSHYDRAAHHASRSKRRDAQKRRWPAMISVPKLRSGSRSRSRSKSASRSRTRARSETRSEQTGFGAGTNSPRSVLKDAYPQRGLMDRGRNSGGLMDTTPYTSVDSVAPGTQKPHTIPLEDEGARSPAGDLIQTISNLSIKRGTSSSLRRQTSAKKPIGQSSSENFPIGFQKSRGKLAPLKGPADGPAFDRAPVSELTTNTREKYGNIDDQVSDKLSRVGISELTTSTPLSKEFNITSLLFDKQVRPRSDSESEWGAPAPEIPPEISGFHDAEVNWSSRKKTSSSKVPRPMNSMSGADHWAGEGDLDITRAPSLDESFENAVAFRNAEEEGFTAEFDDSSALDVPDSVREPDENVIRSPRSPPHDPSQMLWDDEDFDINTDIFKPFGSEDEDSIFGDLKATPKRLGMGTSTKDDLHYPQTVSRVHGLPFASSLFSRAPAYSASLLMPNTNETSSNHGDDLSRHSKGEASRITDYSRGELTLFADQRSVQNESFACMDKWL